MSLTVLGHVVLPNEALPTVVTDKGLLPSVEAEVTTEVGLVIKLLGTEVTLVGLV
jgi:hypothetical protein